MSERKPHESRGTREGEFFGRLIFFAPEISQEWHIMNKTNVHKLTKLRKVSRLNGIYIINYYRLLIAIIPVIV
jgi:hypothetical protein